MGPETAVSAVAPRSPPSGVADARNGVLLVFGAALVWSFGGAIARGLDVGDPWTIIAWRSFFAALFLIGFMLWRDGPAGTIRLFRTMGLPGIGVAVCFATASISFVVALGYTSVANILLMQAGVPLIAALLGVVFLREAVDRVTWGAILAVIAGIGVMVSDSFAANVSFIGDGLALVIAVVFAAATVITRRFSGVRMTPAVCLGVIIGTVVGATLSSGLIVSARDIFSASMKASCGISTLPNWRIFFLPAFCLSRACACGWRRRHSTWRSRPCAAPKWFRARPPCRRWPPGSGS
jgi:drug/metabolite transporter (DMT)-like permease